MIRTTATGTENIMGCAEYESPAQQIRNFKRDMGQLRRHFKSQKSRAAKLCRPLESMGDALDICEEALKREDLAVLSPDRLKKNDEDKLRRWAENACDGNARTTRHLRSWFADHSPSVSAIGTISEILIDRLVQCAADACAKPVAVQRAEAESLRTRLCEIRNDLVGHELAKYFVACTMFGLSVAGPLSVVVIADEQSIIMRAQQRLASASPLFPELTTLPPMRPA
ncbi:hypothetical protein [Roseiconus lacunae]|uniref:hypothetical protein n=1 Tax=Roseiconus lacunae TaxID=2605694 RepID=UPI001E58BC30|nr:hypothetical protein [Roseiconus lacunae]